MRRFKPGWAFNDGEMAVISLMVLTARAIPGQGLLRSFIPALAHPFQHGKVDGEFWRTFSAMGLPEWLFPAGNVANGRQSAVAIWFYSSLFHRLDTPGFIPTGPTRNKKPGAADPRRHRPVAKSRPSPTCQIVGLAGIGHR